MSIGFGIGMVYYGVQFNVENLDFNLYFMVVVSAMMESLAVFVISLLLTYMDYQLFIVACGIISGMSCISCSLLNIEGIFVISTGGRITFISTNFDMLYIYRIELFPTNVCNLEVLMLRQSLMFGVALAYLLMV
eukprot:Gb_18581 [translate_table: standard]